MKRAAAFLLAAVFIAAVFSGCVTSRRNDPNETQTITVYYLRDPVDRITEGLLKPCTIALDKDSDTLHAALSAVTDVPPEEGCVSAFPRDVKINSYSLAGGVLTVNFNSRYKAMAPYERVFAKACLTLTLCGLDEVDYVSVFVDGAPDEELLTPDVMLFLDDDDSDYERQLALYFPDTTLTFLHMEFHTLTMGQSKSVCAYVLDELCRGPQSSELLDPIPNGTRVLSVKQTGDVCTVDLSEEFYSERPETVAGQRLAVYSIVNSLCSVNGVKAVRILIDGSKLDKYGHIDLSSPLKYEPMLDSESYDVRNDTVQTLYLRLDDGSLAEFPVMINRDKYLTREESALRELMNVTTTCGYYSPISDAVELLSVTLENRVCTAVFDEKLLFTGSSERLNRTLEAIANTIAACGNSDRIIIMAGNETVFAKQMSTPDLTNVVQ